MKVLSIDYEVEGPPGLGPFTCGRVTLDPAVVERELAKHPGATITELAAADLDHDTLVSLIEELPGIALFSGERPPPGGNYSNVLPKP